MAEHIKVPSLNIFGRRGTFKKAVAIVRPLQGGVVDIYLTPPTAGQWPAPALTFFGENLSEVRDFFIDILEALPVPTPRLVVQFDMAAGAVLRTQHRLRSGLELKVINERGPGGGNPECQLSGDPKQVRTWLNNNHYRKGDFIVVEGEES